MSIYQRILCPIDGSATAECGMHEAIRLARDQRAAVRFLYVVDLYVMVTYFGPTVMVQDTIDALRATAAATLAQAVQAAQAQGIQAEQAIVESIAGRVAPRIVEQARDWPADLVVLGTHGRRGVSHLVMGSDAEEVVRSSPAPVLLVRGQAAPD